MFSRIHSKLGTAGLIVAVVALVAALAGGAYAASGLNKQQKKQVRNIAKSESKKWSKKFSKRFAKRGPAGAAGATGAQGIPGPQGPQGNPGANGTNGTNGANGKSVVVVDESPAGCPEEEGVAYEIEGSEEEDVVCNGSPWTAGGTLPSGKTETGAWAFGKNAAAGEVDIAVSFPILLAAPLPESNVHFIELVGPDWKEVVLNEGTFEVEFLTPTDCLGTAENPTAAPGHLCVYASTIQNVIILSNFNGIRGAGSNSPGADPTGAVMFGEAETNSRGRGTWAVTAE